MFEDGYVGHETPIGRKNDNAEIVQDELQHYKEECWQLKEEIELKHDEMNSIEENQILWQCQWNVEKWNTNRR